MTNAFGYGCSPAPLLNHVSVGRLVILGLREHWPRQLDPIIPDSEMVSGSHAQTRKTAASRICVTCRHGFIIPSYECLTSTSFRPMDVHSRDGNAAGSSVLDARPLASRF